MQIIIRAAKELQLKSRHHDFFRDVISGLLKPIGDKITQVIVFLQDVNGSKLNGPDKQCVLECRVAGMEPIAIRTRANRLEQAVQQSAKRARRRIAERYPLR